MRALDDVVAFHDVHRPATRLGAQVKAVEIVPLRRLALFHSENVGGGQFPGDGLVGQGDGFAEGFGRLRNVVRRRGISNNPYWNDKPIHDRRVVGFLHVNHVRTFAIFGHECVDIDDMLDAVGHAVGHAGDNHAAVAVTDEHHVVQVFPENDVDDVLNVRAEVNVRAGEIEMFAQAGERWAINGVAVSGEQFAHMFPIPTAAPRAMHDDIGVFFAGGGGLRRRGWGIRFAPDECGEAGQGQGHAFQGKLKVEPSSLRFTTSRSRE